MLPAETVLPTRLERAIASGETPTVYQPMMRLHHPVLVTDLCIYRPGPHFAAIQPKIPGLTLCILKKIIILVHCNRGVIFIVWP